ncbi:MAG: nuclease SbcCD subunit C [Bellilinea sp.]|nr:MAG: nuclease SbcCD subunit C [Bellilinea sp.]
MIPLRLQIKGFLSYRQPVEIDFSELRLASITGHNGAGKSTLLDAITWALFGEARRRDDAVINNQENAAEVLYEFLYEHNRYRVQRSKARGKTALLEFYTLNEEGLWKPLTEHSLTETEKRIRSVLRMDYQTFINASFFLQGKADQFAQQNAANRKRILSNILGLEIWESYRETARSRLRDAEYLLASIKAQMEEQEAELAEEEERRKTLADLKKELKRLSALREAREQRLDDLNRLAAALEEQRRMVEMLAAQLADAEQKHRLNHSRLEARRHEADQLQETLEQADAIEAAYAAWQASRAELERWDQLAQQFQRLQQQRATPQTLLEREQARLEEERRSLQQQQIQAVQQYNQLTDLQNKRQELTAQQQALEARLAKREQIQQALLELKEQTAQKRTQISHWQENMEALQERLQRLHADEDSGHCPLCGQPLGTVEREGLIRQLEGEYAHAQGEIQALLKQIEENRRLQQQLEDRLKDTLSADQELQARQRQVSALEARIQQIEEQYRQWQSHAAVRLQEVEQILTSGQYALEARQQLAEIDTALMRLGYDPQAHAAARVAEQQARSAEQALRQLEAARAQLKPLLNEIAVLEKTLREDEARLQQLRTEHDHTAQKYRQDSAGLPDLDALENELADLKTEENQLRYRIGAAEQKVNVLTSVRARLQENQTRYEECARLIARLKILDRAFGKDGVPALLIEQALPEIEARANQILSQLSNGGMNIRFETQAEYKDKKRQDKKETLDIIISDSAGIRPYEMYSGGEAFRVNFAIRLALSHVLANRAGARLQTLFIDEGFGSQDTEGRQRLIEAINAVKDEFACILVITHLDELKDAFPARIEVEKNSHGSTVRVLTL